MMKTRLHSPGVLFFRRTWAVLLSLGLGLPNPVYASRSHALRAATPAETGLEEEISQSLQTGLEEVDYPVKQLLAELFQEDMTRGDRLNRLVDRLEAFDEYQRVQFLFGFSWLQDVPASELAEDIFLGTGDRPLRARQLLMGVNVGRLEQERGGMDDYFYALVFVLDQIPGLKDETLRLLQNVRETPQIPEEVQQAFRFAAALSLGHAILAALTLRGRRWQGGVAGVQSHLDTLLALGRTLEAVTPNVSQFRGIASLQTALTHLAGSILLEEAAREAGGEGGDESAGLRELLNSRGVPIVSEMPSDRMEQRRELEEAILQELDLKRGNAETALGNLQRQKIRPIQRGYLLRRLALAYDLSGIYSGFRPTDEPGAQGGLADLVRSEEYQDRLSDLRAEQRRRYELPAQAEQGTVEMGIAQHVGGRTRQEDSVGEKIQLGNATAFLLADGMGGEFGGQEASRFALDALSLALKSEGLVDLLRKYQEFQDTPRPGWIFRFLLGRTGAEKEIREDLQRKIRHHVSSAILQVNTALQRKKQELGFSRMGTTMAMALLLESRIGGSELAVFSVGDTPVFVWRARTGRLDRLTLDETVSMGSRLSSGVSENKLRNPRFLRKLHREEAANPSMRGYVNKPVSFLGRSNLSVVRENWVLMKRRDMAVLVTDGVLGGLSDPKGSSPDGHDELEALMKEHGSLSAQALAEKIISESGKNPGGDNRSAVIGRLSAGLEEIDPAANGESARWEPSMGAAGVPEAIDRAVKEQLARLEDPEANADVLETVGQTFLKFNSPRRIQFFQGLVWADPEAVSRFLERAFPPEDGADLHPTALGRELIETARVDSRTLQAYIILVSGLPVQRAERISREVSFRAVEDRVRMAPLSYATGPAVIYARVRSKESEMHREKTDTEARERLSAMSRLQRRLGKLYGENWFEGLFGFDLQALTRTAANFNEAASGDGILKEGVETLGSYQGFMSRVRNKTPPKEWSEGSLSAFFVLSNMADLTAARTRYLERTGIADREWLLTDLAFIRVRRLTLRERERMRYGLSAGLEEDAAGWTRQKLGVPELPPQVMEALEKGMQVRLVPKTQGIPAAEATLAEGFQVIAQEGVVPDALRAVLSSQFGAVQNFPKQLEDLKPKLMQWKQEISSQAVFDRKALALLLVDFSAADELRELLSEIDPTWEIPIVVVGIREGALETPAGVSVDPNAVLSYLNDLLGQATHRIMDRLEGVLTLDDQRRTWFLSTGV